MIYATKSHQPISLVTPVQLAIFRVPIDNRGHPNMTDVALKESNSSSSGLSVEECEEAAEEVLLPLVFVIHRQYYILTPVPCVGKENLGIVSVSSHR